MSSEEEQINKRPRTVRRRLTRDQLKTQMIRQADPCKNGVCQLRPPQERELEKKRHKP